MSNPEHYLKNHASYGGTPDAPIDPEWEKFLRTPFLLKAGVQRIIHDVGTLSLYVANELQKRDLAPDVVVDDVKYRDHWWKGKVETSRSTVGSGWVLQHNSARMLEAHYEDAPSDKAPGRMVPARLQRATGICLLQDGRTVRYLGYLKGEPLHDNPRVHKLNDFTSGEVDFPYDRWARPYDDRDKYAAALLQVSGVEPPYGTRVLGCVYSSNAEEQAGAAYGWMNRLEAFAKERAIPLRPGSGE